MPDQPRIGLIINPIAGIGGRLAAHGSDRFAGSDDARMRAGQPVSRQRAERALVRLRQAAGDVAVLTASGAMGGDAALQSGFQPLVIAETGERTTAEDTARALRLMIGHGIDVLLFAGGDGTARDIFAVAGDRLPIIGIPTGVKMHSAVFALSPEAAGETAAIAIGRACGVRRAEVMDADEAELAAGRPSARLFGYAQTPAVPRLLQPAKASRPDGGEAAIAALGRLLAREMPTDRLVIFGPGTTMQAVKLAFGFEGTLLGVDAFADGKVVALDADAGRLEALCESRAHASILVGVIGNQGFVFGRGNQQISPAVIRAARRGNIHIIATREKLTALPSPELRLDTGDEALDGLLTGYHRVRTGPFESMTMRVSAAL